MYTSVRPRVNQDGCHHEAQQIVGAGMIECYHWGRQGHLPRVFGGITMNRVKGVKEDHKVPNNRVSSCIEALFSVLHPPPPPHPHPLFPCPQESWFSHNIGDGYSSCSIHHTTIKPHAGCSGQGSTARHS